MICNFKTQIEGTPTLFPEKIIAGAMKHNLFNYDDTETVCEASIFNLRASGYHYDYNSVLPKIHTLREDINNRYQIDKQLHLSINSRQKNYCQILPTLPVRFIQKVEIKISKNNITNVIIDGRHLTKREIVTLAINDGFDDVFQFFNWFNKNQKLKLIHWVPGFKY